MKIKIFQSLSSTNSYLKDSLSEIEEETMIIALEQTAGRGQRGNSWEAAPGKNLTLSFYFRPVGIKPAAQFVISEAVALAVVDTLNDYGLQANVKWPNDIYVSDKKIAGILIENSILGTLLSWSLVGIGLNVNQTEFFSDAPNPVSMAQLLDCEVSLPETAGKLGKNLDKYLQMLKGDVSRKEIHHRYLSKLWRADGNLHNFQDCATSEKFKARIKDVELTGHLLLESDDGAMRRYAFKEVTCLI